MSSSSKFSRRTTITHAGRHPHDNHGVVNPPVYHASTILQPSLDAFEASRKPDWKGYRYGRAGTPTSRSFEEAVTELYGAAGSVAVSSGLASITNALLAVTKAGDHILVTDNAYGPTRRFCNTFLARFGVETTYYDPSLGAGIDALFKDNTVAVFTEAPGSQTFEMSDIPAIAKAAHDRSAVVLMDNTWASPLYFDAFNKGVDIVVEAVTKYICGHSDVMMGIIVGNDDWAGPVRDMAKMHGNACGPDDLYLAQRGLRTLAVRMEQNQANGLALADWLRGRPEVKRVLHPGLTNDPGHEIWKRDFTGASGLFSFVLNEGYSRAALAALLDGLELYGMGASWGGYESLIIPANPTDYRTATPWTEAGQLLRIHAGLEDVDDLIADLGAGLDRLTAVDSAAR
ncbi:MAG: cystathionine beta-lyase [Alphaproteobacteria bacterium]|nr:cystathionine beta-lyase [Alphaproteobacteria bacterium]